MTPAVISIEDRLGQLEARLRHLEELEQVRNVLSRYCKVLDDRDLPGMQALFARQARLLVEPYHIEVRGCAAITEFYRSYFGSPWKDPRHNIANEYIERRGEVFHALSYFHETLEREGESYVGWGTWQDILALENGAWKFEERVIVVLALSTIRKGWAGPDKIVPL